MPSNTAATFALAAAFVVTAWTTAALALDVDDVLIQLIEEVNVPAREAGVLATMEVHEGQVVSQADVLARMEDTAVQIARRRAALELTIAEKNSQNDVRVRLARKSQEVAEAELRRAQESVSTYSGSVSETEMDRLRLTVQRAALEIEQALHDIQVTELDRRLKENECQSAEYQLQRRQLISPLHGVVAEIKPRPGEWVEPGQRVLRVLRIDRLRAEGFIAAKDLSSDLVGSPVTLSVSEPGQPPASYDGTLVFVSSEVDPVDGQVLVWAEVHNQGMRLRPGLRARMTIHGPPSPERAFISITR